MSEHLSNIRGSILFCVDFCTDGPTSWSIFNHRVEGRRRGNLILPGVRARTRLQLIQQLLCFLLNRNEDKFVSHNPKEKKKKAVIDHVPAQPANARELPVYHYSHIKAKRRLQHPRSKASQNTWWMCLSFLPVTSQWCLFYWVILHLLNCWCEQVNSASCQCFQQVIRIFPKCWRHFPSCKPPVPPLSCEVLKPFWSWKTEEGFRRNPCYTRSFWKRLSHGPTWYLLTNIYFRRKKHEQCFQKSWRKDARGQSGIFLMQTTCKPCIRLLVFLISLSYLLCCSDTIEDQHTIKQILINLTHKNLILRKIHLNQLKSD